jgi:nitrogen PTS system EIIA component
MIAQLIESAGVCGELEAKTKEGALKELLQSASQAGAFPGSALKTLQKRLADREAIGSTGLGNGVAVPHIKSDDIERVALVVGRKRQGLDWQAIDGRPVQILFLLLSPASEPETHLQCLRWIAGLARSGDFRRFLIDAVDASAIKDLLREMSGKVGM